MANFLWKIFSKVDNFIRKVFDQIVSARALILTKNFLENALHRRRGICVCSVQDQSNSKWCPIAQPGTPTTRDDDCRLDPRTKQINLSIWVATPCFPQKGIFRFD